MTQPAVTTTELDGALGVLPPSSGALFALVGVSSSGPIDTPATYARITDIVTAYGYGPLVEAAAHYIEKYGRPVILVRTGQTTTGTADAVVFVGTGTSVPTEDGTLNPGDDFQVYFKVIAGGTIGVTGITFQYSLDGGRTLSPVIALGTAANYTIASSSVKVNFAAGTLVAGDTFSFRTHAPRWTTAEVQSALDALRNSSVFWSLVEIVGDLDGAGFDAIDLKVIGMATKGKYRAWIGSFRMPNLSETEAAYLAAFVAIFASRSTKHGMVCAGACKLVSSVNRAGASQYRRPVAFAVAAREASVSEEIDTADVNLGSLGGVSIVDTSGNPDEHDESINPGLDDARATVLRTWEGIQGVYVNRPRIMSADGSDFQLMPHRRVMNITEAALRLYLIRRLNKPIRVDKNTGFILEAEALEIEAGGLAVMRSTVLAKPKASAVQFIVSRTDNILSTKTLKTDARIIPLAYPEFIEETIGFLNPALQVVAV